MKSNKDKKQTNISNANSVEEISEFWDYHSLSDYWDQTKDVNFEIRALHKRCIALDQKTHSKI